MYPSSMPRHTMTRLPSVWRNVANFLSCICKGSPLVRGRTRTLSVLARLVCSRSKPEYALLLIQRHIHHTYQEVCIDLDFRDGTTWMQYGCLGLRGISLSSDHAPPTSCRGLLRQRPGTPFHLSRRPSRIVALPQPNSI